MRGSIARLARGSLVVTLAVAILLPSSSASTFAGRNGKLAFSRLGERTGIFVSRRDGSHVKRLTRGADGAAAWSPDGGRLAFVRSSTETSVQVIDGDGTGRHRVSEASAPGCVVQAPRWSYDGLFLAYVDDCFDNEPRVAQIRIATAEGDAHQVLTDYDSTNGLSRQPWSPDLENSSQLVFTSDRDGDFDVYIMNSDGTEVVQLTNEEDHALEAVWSPDGSTIAYTVQRLTQPQSSLWAVSPAGGEPTLLVEGNAHATEPVWSPDGNRLMFARRTRNGAPTLTVVDADGGNEVTIRRGAESISAAWSPNSRAVLVMENGDLVRYRLGHPVTRKVIVRSAPLETGPAWQAR